LTAPAALFTDFLIASFASPAAFWASPLISCAALSVCNRSEPTKEPIPCLALPIASFATPDASSRARIVPLSIQLLATRWLVASKIIGLLIWGGSKVSR
jgi:hypothetical protein